MVNGLKIFGFGLALFALCCTPGCGEVDTLDVSDHHMVAGKQAAADGDHAKAIEEFTAALTFRPEVWAYYERARSHLELGDEAAAKADCESGLQVQPDNQDLKWLLAEVSKPKARRFKGNTAEPPRNFK